jgi:hypothetical protein
MMVIPITPKGATEPIDYITVDGERIELWVGSEPPRVFYIHEDSEGVKILSDFRSGQRIPDIDLSVGSPQEALNRVVYRFKPGYILSVMNAAPQLNLL